MNLQQAYYDQRFEVLFLRSKGDEFQTLFERLMGLAYKADFMPCRPWGNAGDRKNDGYLTSERCLFQVYAPNEMEAKKVTTKIIEDFEGAKPYWRDHFDKWVFAHNATDGLPPHVQKTFLDLKAGNPEITIEPWGLEEFRVVFRRLSADDLSSWLGATPTEETQALIGFKDIQVVLESLATRTVSVDGAVKGVPQGKIEANDLSDSVTTLIKSGMIRTPLVSGFIDSWYDETFGERLAEAFRAEYSRLRGTAHPNFIFSELQAWVGGNQLGTPEHQIAVLTVLAYYFERCDIFEEPRNIHS